ncbi:MAG: hypothetical protein IKD83_01150 [Firmicutes bacterium]|nr:hypothetical protein [Bacillota bacterium]
MKNKGEKMKVRMILAALVIGVFICQPTMAAERLTTENTIYMIINNKTEDPRSQYIRDYNGDLTSLGNGTIEASATLTASNTDKIEIKAQFQKKSNGNWNNYGSAIKVSRSASSMALEKQKDVSAGTYRVKFTYKAYVGSSAVETRTLTTSSVTVR